MRLWYPLSHSAGRALPLSLVYIPKLPFFRFNEADLHIAINSIARLELFASWPNQMITLPELLYLLYQFNLINDCAPIYSLG